MRTGWFALLVITLLMSPLPATAGGTSPEADLALVNVSHTVDGTELVVSGWVENRGRQPAGRLMVDVSGFSPSGDLASFGSDGIPWEIAPGQSERFTVRLPIHQPLIRDYVVQVAFARVPVRPLTGVRRGVDLALYRPLIFSMVKVRGDVLTGLLMVTSHAGGLPVTQVTVEATLFLPDPVFSRLQTLTLNLPADGSVSVPLGIGGAALLTLRITDILLKTAWSD